MDEYISLDNGARKTTSIEDAQTRQVKVGNFTVQLKPHQTFMDLSHTLTPEEIKKVIEDEKIRWREPADSNQTVDRTVDRGCPALKNLDDVWMRMGEVFVEYKTANTDDLSRAIQERVGDKIKVSWDAGQNLAVNGLRTKISHAVVKEAYLGLVPLSGEAGAAKIIASVIAKKIEKLF